MNTTLTTQTVTEWEETIALTLIAAWTLGLIAFVNAFGNHYRAGQWRPVGEYQASISTKPTTLYEQTLSTGETMWRYKTTDNTWSYPRVTAVRRRARGLDLWTDD